MSLLAQHPESAHFAATGLFAGVRSYSELEKRIEALPDEITRGHAFEVFAEAYLAINPLMAAEIVWPGSRMPAHIRDRLRLPMGRDIGVDGAFEADGRTVAFQVKFRSDRRSLSFGELSTFLGASDYADDRLLFTNASDVDGVVKDRTRLRILRGSDLDTLDEWQLNAIAAFIAGSSKPARIAARPRPDQELAISRVLDEFIVTDRAGLVMACGSGKTKTSIWIADRLGGRNMIVFAPSLALIRQTLLEWASQNPWGTRFRYLCVCSDDQISASASSEEQIGLKQSDVPFPTTTDGDEIAEFLGRTDDIVRVVFCTYQSSPVLAAAARRVRFRFDLAVFDEAHKTVGAADSTFAHALSDEHLTCGKRLFMTATPRVRRGTRRASDGAQAVVSMDDVQIYGRVAHTLTFAEAARMGIICNYKILVSIVRSDELGGPINNGSVLLDGIEVPARHVAAQIALARAAAEYSCEKIITFHSSIRDAERFAVGPGSTGPRLPGYAIFHVNGTQGSAARGRVIELFGQAEKGLVTNARCLTEGVDIPAVDLVAFISPKRSKVDIVQAVGRALRRSGGKQFGYVLVPVLVDVAAGEPIEAAVSRTSFDDVWEVLASLMDQDDDLVEVVDAIALDRGRTHGLSGRLRERLAISFAGMPLDVAALERAVEIRLVDALSSPWMHGYRHLMDYADANGGAAVPSSYRDADGFALGAWVLRQRHCRRVGTLSMERQKLLEGVPGWCWNLHDRAFVRGLQRLQAYVALHNSADVPFDFCGPDGYRLGRWVANQRLHRRMGRLPDERIAALEQIPGWKWEVFDDEFAKAFVRLRTYAEHNGNPHVPLEYKEADGFPLGRWVARRRDEKRIGHLSGERMAALESLLGWTWDNNESAFMHGFGRLQAYAERVGGARVPATHLDDDGYRLGVWTCHQRVAWRQKKLSPARQTLLESIPGWSWHAFESAFTSGFERLQAYVARHGNGNVPRSYKDADGYELGAWVRSQRQYLKRGRLSVERQALLEKISGWTWDGLEARRARRKRRISASSTRTLPPAPLACSSPA